MKSSPEDDKKFLVDLTKVPSEQVAAWRETLDHLSQEVSQVANPPLQVEERELEDGRKFRVVRDDNLQAGTKQRALVPLIVRHRAQELVYASPIYGYAQVALAYSCKLAGGDKRGTVFVSRVSERHPLTKAAAAYGAKIMEVNRHGLAAVQEEANRYCQADPVREHLPFGLYSAEFIWTLKTQIERAMPKDLHESPPTRVWVVAGSGTLVCALHEVWPQAEFLIVQVGKYVNEKMVEKIKHRVFVAPEKFGEEAVHPPPFSSAANYDAKLWQFFVKEAQPGDLIWNVASDARSKAFE